MKSIFDAYDEWWESTGSWMDRKDVYIIAKKSFLCGYNVLNKRSCDGRYEDTEEEGKPDSSHNREYNGKGDED
jgi:hypothetical protein